MNKQELICGLCNTELAHRWFCYRNLEGKTIAVCKWCLMHNSVKLE